MKMWLRVEPFAPLEREWRDTLISAWLSAFSFAHSDLFYEKFIYLFLRIFLFLKLVQ